MISSNYKNAHAGKSGVLFGTGPSLNDFDFSLIPEERSSLINVGVNSIVYHKEIDINYYFCAQDVAKEPSDHPHKSVNGSCMLLAVPLFKKIKERMDTMHIFCANRVDGYIEKEFFIDAEIEEMGASTYELTMATGPEVFRKDVTSGPLHNHSIVFPALQFLLYTGVSKIYIVGCDCGGGNSYLVMSKLWADQYARDNITSFWGDFKIFKEKEYPEVKIVSVNPKGLTGFFDEDIFGD